MVHDAYKYRASALFPVDTSIQFVFTKYVSSIILHTYFINMLTEQPFEIKKKFHRKFFRKIIHFKIYYNKIKLTKSCFVSA